MHLAVANSATKNSRFNSALHRTSKDRQVLRDLLKNIKIDDRFSALGFVIGDRPTNYLKVVPKVDESIDQVFLGYDLDGDYMPEQD